MTPDEVRALDLVDVTEIARRTGKSGPAVHNWIARYDGTPVPGRFGRIVIAPPFPAPIIDVPRHRLWAWDDVAAWLRLTGRIGAA